MRVCSHLVFVAIVLASFGTGYPAVACTSNADCNDNNPCTDDLCDVVQGCRHYNNSSACNDGNACTTGDVCEGSVCVGGNAVAGCSSCDAVATIPPQGGTLVGQTSGTGTLAATCGSSGTAGERVYLWVPPTSGQATIRTCGSGTLYDTVLSLRSGSCTGSEIACNDDACSIGDGTSHGSQITPTVTGGQPYYIVVDGYGGHTGTYGLTVLPPQTCGNNVREGSEQCDGTDTAGCGTHQCTAQCTCVPPAGGLADLTAAISDVTFQTNATVDPGDVGEGCAEATSGVDLLRFSVSTSNVGTADLHLGDPQCPACATACGTCAASCGSCTSCALCTCTNPEFMCSPAQGHNHAHYTNYARYELLDATDQAVVVGHKQGFCLGDFLCTGAATPKYTCTDQGITAGCSDLYSFDLGCQYLDVTGVPPGNYTLRVTVDPYNLIPELNEGNNVTTIPVVLSGATTTTTTVGSGSTTSTILGSGSCSTPVILPAGGGTFTGTTRGASALSGSCTAATASAPEQVFQWTPVTSGTATIRTCGTATTFDTVLYVRRGGCGGTEVACNDDATGCAVADFCSNIGNHGSAVTLSVTAGQTYSIVVDGYGGSCGGSSGNFQLTVVPPAGAATTTTTSTSRTSTTRPSTTSTSRTTSSTQASTTSTARSSTTSSIPAATTTTLPSACAVPTIVPAAGGTFTGTTSGASTLSGCVSATATAPERVFQWTPTTSGTATIQTCGAGTTFDTVLYVRAGACNGGTQLACNDDTSGCATGDPCVSNGHHGSLVTLTVTAGQTYYIVVDGYAGSCGGASGSFGLTVTPP